jgi:hypothetical protein
VTAGGVALYEATDSAGLLSAVPKFNDCFGPCNNGRIDYDAMRDRMVLAGFTETSKDTGKQWGQVRLVVLSRALCMFPPHHVLLWTLSCSFICV